MALIARSVEVIFSASSSGISIPNSSSMDITTSTASKLSKPKSSLKLAVGVTYAMNGKMEIAESIPINNVPLHPAPATFNRLD